MKSGPGAVGAARGRGTERRRLPMQHQPIELDVAETDEQAEREVLVLLLESGPSGPWSIWELGLQIGSDITAVDAVIRFHAAGLVHLCHEFVWPTRTAARSHQLADAA
jgi:hypothetical protein